MIGYAYRPVNNDRLNALAKYTYFFNVPTTDQVTLQDTAAEFIQKSHVAAVDVSAIELDLTVGGKYAYRLGEVSLDRVNRDFFDIGATRIVRTDWRFREGWRACSRRTLDCKRGPAPRRYARRGLPLPRRALQGRRRLQLHGLPDDRPI